MTHLNAIFRVLIIVAFVSASLPLQMLEDIHYDGSIDLKDAISAVRQFEGSAINPEKFAETVKTAVSTMEVAADLKTVIKTDRSSSLQGTPFNQAPVLIASVVGVSNTLMAFSGWRDTFTPFTSADLLPPTPPPKLA